MTLLEFELDVLGLEELKTGIQDINCLFRELIGVNRGLEELLHVIEVLFESLNTEA